MNSDSIDNWKDPLRFMPVFWAIVGVAVTVWWLGSEFNWSLTKFVSNPWVVGVGSVLVLLAIVAVVVCGHLFPVWLQARLSGAPVVFLQMLGMRLRKVDVQLVVANYI